jgi:hypothetical protein
MSAIGAGRSLSSGRSKAGPVGRRAKVLVGRHPSKHRGSAEGRRARLLCEVEPVEKIVGLGVALL